jgi:hypothetical protein
MKGVLEDGGELCSYPYPIFCVLFRSIRLHLHTFHTCERSGQSRNHSGSKTSRLLDTRCWATIPHKTSYLSHLLQYLFIKSSTP